MADAEKRHRIRPATTERSRTLRRRMSGPEIRLWSILRRSQLGGYKFRRQAPIGGFFVDFYCPQLKLAIEVDGETHVGRGDRDVSRTRAFESLGVMVVRVTNDDVLYNLHEVAEYLLTIAMEQDRRTSR